MTTERHRTFDSYGNRCVFLVRSMSPRHRYATYAYEADAHAHFATVLPDNPTAYVSCETEREEHASFIRYSL